MVFGLFKKSSGDEQVTTYSDVTVVSLQKSAYYADARDNLLKTVQQAVEDSPTGRVVIEMSNVKQFTSGPLGALVVCARKAESADIHLDENELEAAMWVSKNEMREALAGRNDSIAPARKGAVAQIILQSWVDGIVPGF